ncbi:hypothetical protein D3C72_1381050 [compost metagenome]
MNERQHQRADRAHGAGLGRRGDGLVHEGQAAHRAEHREDQDGRGNDAAQALAPQRPAVQRARRGGQAGHVVRTDARDQEGVDREDHHLQDRRTPGALVHLADVGAELVGHDDQHQRGRHQLRDGSRGGEHAGRVTHVVAVAHHDRQRDHRHRDHLAGHRAGDGAEDEAHDDHRVAQAAADRAEELAHRVEHVLGEPAFF